MCVGKFKVIWNSCRKSQISMEKYEDKFNQDQIVYEQGNFKMELSISQ